MSEKYKIKLRQGNKVRLFLDVDFQKLSTEAKQAALQALISEQNAAASAALFDDLNNIISEDADNDITLGSDGKLYSLPGGGGDSLFQLKDPQTIEPRNDRTVDAASLSGEVFGGLFQP
jgi:hypothetical protein